MTAPTSAADHALADARERVKLPGIFLVVVGLLNLIVAGLVVVPALQLLGKSDEDLKELAREVEEDLTKLFPAGRLPGLAGVRTKELRFQTAVSAGAGTVMLLFAGMTIVGGWRMVRLRSRGLAIAGSALVTIPCLSPLSCCLVGEAVGLWSLVVLFNPAVSAAFAARPSHP